ncbi:MAG TPA: hypothetical protein IAA62_04250 [Candidatus Caccopulliclostridium gallistercoris]|uniref:Lipoprotein n=1 Tax=Candidatus Caccopulliclostridium gallistercoris TaxID=2840719 RepID=A0A9D1NFJ3_9FIRM|nr:hypothetical protein [Candidatus Caccopulliclostridium gallistercoris]
MKKVLKIICLLSVIVLVVILFTGCVDGVVSEENYCEIFYGVDAEDDDGNSVYYEMRTLVDDTEFNSSIQSKPYCKLDISLKKSCQIRGVVFIVRSSEDCTLKFTTYIDGDSKSVKTKTLTKGVTTDIDLFFSDPVSCNSQTEFYIEVEENKSEDKTAFQFDSLIIFLKE